MTWGSGDTKPSVFVGKVAAVLCACGLPGCRSHCNGCMNVAWDSCWGGSRSTKPCVFPWKLAAAGHEGQLLCEAGAAWIVSTRNRFFHGVLQRLDANRIVVAA